MASFEKRGKRTRVVVSVMQDGVRRKVSKTFDTKKAATDWAILMEADKLQDKKIISSRMLFSDYFKMWMDVYKKRDIRESTYQTYQRKLSRIKKYFPNITIDKLSYQLLQSTCDDMGTHMSQGTMSGFVISIKDCLKDAKYDGYITTDIFSRLKPHGLKRDKKANVLSAIEFEKLQEYLYRNHNTLADIAILVGLETGMRIGEVLGLSSADVSIPFNYITVNKSYSSNIKKMLPPKNKSSYRKIKITQGLTNILATCTDSPRIFNMNNAHVRYRLNKLLKKLGLTPVTIHGLRHSHASYLLYKGVSINYVSARLGHSSTDVTQKVYAHMLKEEKQNEQEKTIDILGLSPNVPRKDKKVDLSRG